jgi:Ras-related protein Rab-1A
MSSDFDYLSKILVIGNAGAGKSCLISRYVDKEYTDNYLNTIGVDFKTKILLINDKKIKINIWDTAGQEKFRSLVTSYYRNSDIIIIVFDLTNNISFQNIDSWYSDITSYCIKKSYKLYLVGTKADMGKDKFIVDEISIKEKCKQYDMKYFATSSKKNYNLDNLFNDIVHEIYNIKIIEESNLLIEDPEPIKEPIGYCLNCNIM